MRARPRLTTPWRTPKRSGDQGEGAGTAAALERSTARRWRASTSCLGRAMRWQGSSWENTLVRLGLGWARPHMGWDTSIVSRTGRTGPTGPASSLSTLDQLEIS